LKNGEEDIYTLTYTELDQRARRIAARLQDCQTLGERALLLYAPGLDYIEAFFGCLYAGVIAVPAYPPRQNRNIARIEAILQDAQATIAMTSHTILEILRRKFPEIVKSQTLRWIDTDESSKDTSSAQLWHRPEVNSNDLAFLQYTSGSTGTPKGVMVSHQNLLHNSLLLQQLFQATQQSCMVSWLPPYHDMGLISGILQAVYTGFPLVFMSPATFLQHPFRWLQAISRYRATISGAPNFAYELCMRSITSEQQKMLDLSSWTIAFSGAEPVQAETLTRFTQKFAVNGLHLKSFMPAYGLAEATLVVTATPRHHLPTMTAFQSDGLSQGQAIAVTPPAPAARTLVGCGYTLGADQQVLIVDPTTQERCQPGQIGEIWLSGPSVAQGYWQQATETEYTFHAFLKDTGEGPFLRTEDLGFFHENELFIAGRIKDIIILNGINYYPQDIELTVEKCHPALLTGSTAAFSLNAENGKEHLVIAAEIGRQYRHGD
jgi:acyl-CoA synthetase (AMP-forming)/AMP-acid ligase II